MSEVEVVAYDREWVEAHTAFATDAWPTKFRRRDPAYLRWKFRGPETGPVPGLMLAVRDGVVLGQVGCLPGVGWINGETMPIQWYCDVMLSPDARGQGILQLLNAGALERGTRTVSSDPSPAAAKSFARYGFVQHTSSWIMVLTLAAGPVVAKRYPQAARLAPLVSAAGRPVLRYVNRGVRDLGPDNDAVMCSWRDVIDDVVDAERAITAPHAVHDREFLTWRCQGLDGWNRELEAVRTPAGSFAIIERAEEYLCVQQWRADTAPEAAKVFARVAYIGRSYGASYLQTYASTEADKARLEALGFRARRTRVDFWSYPADTLDGTTEPWAFQGYDSDYRL